MDGNSRSCGGVSVFAGTFWHFPVSGQSLAVSGKPQLDCGRRRDPVWTPSNLWMHWMHHGWPHSFDRWLRCRWSEARSGIASQHAGMQSGVCMACRHNSHQKLFSLTLTLTHIPPPSLRPAGIPTGHGGYAPGCCVCGACKSRPTGLLRRDTLDISNPSRLPKDSSRNQKLSTRI
jgi:hypothetical protein